MNNQTTTNSITEKKTNMLSTGKGSGSSTSPEESSFSGSSGCSDESGDGTDDITFKSVNHDDENQLMNSWSTVDIVTIREQVEAFEKESIRRMVVRDAGKDIEKWLTGPSKNGVNVFYSPVEHSEWFTMKSTTIVNLSPDEALAMLTGEQNVPMYDEMTAKVTCLEHLSDKTEIRLVDAKSVMFTTARDFCVATTIEKDAEGRIIIATRSVTHPEGRDDRKGFCRATSMISGFVITPLDDNNSCHVSVLAHMDLGGYMPAVVLKFLGLTAPIKLLSKVKELVKNGTFPTNQQ